jgi:hypothetical protein
VEEPALYEVAALMDGDVDTSTRYVIGPVPFEADQLTVAVLPKARTLRLPGVPGAAAVTGVALAALDASESPLMLTASTWK